MPHAPTPGPPANHNGRMESINDQLEKLMISKEAATGGRHGGSDHEPRFPKSSRIDDNDLLEGWTLDRAVTNSSPNDLRWHVADRSSMCLSQEDLARLVKKPKKTSVAERYEKLGRLKRQHISSLIEDRKKLDKDPRFDWTCVYIKPVERTVRRQMLTDNYITVSLHVVLKRTLRPGAMLTPRSFPGEVKSPEFAGRNVAADFKGSGKQNPVQERNLHAQPQGMGHPGGFQPQGQPGAVRREPQIVQQGPPPNVGANPGNGGPQGGIPQIPGTQYRHQPEPQLPPGAQVIPQTPPQQKQQQHQPQQPHTQQHPQRPQQTPPQNPFQPPSPHPPQQPLQQPPQHPTQNHTQHLPPAPAPPSPPQHPQQQPHPPRGPIIHPQLDHGTFKPGHAVHDVKGLGKKKQSRDQCFPQGQWPDMDSGPEDSDPSLFGFHDDASSTNTDDSFLYDEYDKHVPSPGISRHPSRGRGLPDPGYRLPRRPSHKHSSSTESKRYSQGVVDLIPANSKHRGLGRISRSATVSHALQPKPKLIHGQSPPSPIYPRATSPPMRYLSTSFAQDWDREDRERALTEHIRNKNIEEREDELFRRERDLDIREMHASRYPSRRQPPLELDSYDRFDRMERLDHGRRPYGERRLYQ